MREKTGGRGREGERERERKCSATKADRTEEPSRFFNLRTPKTSGEGGNGKRRDGRGGEGTRRLQVRSRTWTRTVKFNCARLARAMRVKIGWVG